MSSLRWVVLGLLLASCDFSADAEAYRANYCAKVCAAGAAECAVHCDGGVADAGARDAGPTDAGPTDAGSTDAGPPDAGPTDAGPTDAGPNDAGSNDAGPTDAGPTDAGPTDAGPTDAGPTDAGGWVVQLTSASSLALTTLTAWGDGVVVAGRGDGLWLQDTWLAVDAGAQQVLIVRIDGAGAVPNVARLSTRATADFEFLLPLGDAGLIAVGTLSGPIAELPSLGLDAGTDVMIVGFGPALTPLWAHRLGGGDADRVVAAWLDSATSALVAMTFPLGGLSAGVTVPRGTAVVRVRFDGGLEHVEHFPEVLLRGMAQVGATRVALGEPLRDGGTGGLFAPLTPGGTFVAVSDGGPAYQLAHALTHDGAADLDCNVLSPRGSGVLVGCFFDDDAPAHLFVGGQDAGVGTAFSFAVGAGGQLQSLAALPRRATFIPSFAGAFETRNGVGYGLSELPFVGEDDARYLIPRTDGGFDESVHGFSLRFASGGDATFAYLLGVVNSGSVGTRTVFPGATVSYDGGWRAFAAKVRLP